MGSSIEINDTLKLKRGHGFPTDLEIGREYTFTLAGRRLYHLQPVRVYLVEDVDGRWRFVGHAMVLEQTIDAEKEETRGRYRVVSLYPPEYARLVNEYEAPAGKGFVEG